jgi:hypothetical protein
MTENSSEFQRGYDWAKNYIEDGAIANAARLERVQDEHTAFDRGAKAFLREFMNPKPTTEAPKPDIEKEREAFEVWVVKVGSKHHLARDGEDYFFRDVTNCWKAWKARAGIDQ